MLASPSAGPAVGAPGAATDAAPAPVDPGATYPSSEGHRSFWDAGRVAGVALVGVGLAGIGAGVLFGSSSDDASSRASDLQTRLGRDACAGTAAPSDCAALRSARDDQDRNSTLSTVFVAGGAAFAAAGVALFVWPRSQTHLAPSVTGQGASLQITGRF